MKLYYTIPTLCALLLLGCIKEENSSFFEDVPVIEGYLLANDIINLKISRQVPFLEGVEYSNEDINSLNIKVSNMNNLKISVTFLKIIHIFFHSDAFKNLD